MRDKRVYLLVEGNRSVSDANIAYRIKATSNTRH